jgi:hypothetical protein
LAGGGLPVTPYKQLFKHDPENGVYGDCARTVVACMLDVRPESVPHENRVLEDGQQRQILNDFLRPMGLAIMFLAFPQDPQEMMEIMAVSNPGLHYMLSGLSRTGCNHVVICQDDKIVHDPSLTDAGIVGRCDDGLTYIEMLVKI